MPITTYNLVSNLPTEIILEFAPYLERPSIFKAIRVCRRWSDILSPLVWKSISKTDWHIPYFPIQQSKDTIRYDDSLLVPFLEYTQTLEWHNNLSLVPTGLIPRVQTQIPTERLAHILSMAPNLVMLSLRIVDDHLSPALYYSIRDLKFLNRLDISLPTSQESSQTPLTILFPLFERLEELNIDGSWHIGEGDSYDSIIKPDDFTINDNINDNDGLILLPPMDRSWKIKQLTIDSPNSFLIRHCPALEELRIFHPRNLSIVHEKKVSEIIRWRLYKPPHLKIFDLYCAQQATAYSFKVHDPNQEDSSRPHRLLCWYSQEWWSTQEIGLLF